MVATLRRSFRSNTSRSCWNKAGLPKNGLMLKYSFSGPTPRDTIQEVWGKTQESAL